VVLKIDLPGDVKRALEKRWSDLPQHLVETLAVEGYREGVLSPYQIQCMLGLESRFEVDDFLKERGVPLDYGLDDLEQDAETLQKLRPARSW
jgi:predicted HTH domain antitoxin